MDWVQANALDSNTHTNPSQLDVSQILPEPVETEMKDMKEHKSLLLTDRNGKITEERKESVLIKSYKEGEGKLSMKKINLALLINGSSLTTIFQEESLRVAIKKLFVVAKSVIVYRSSPSEKA